MSELANLLPGCVIRKTAKNSHIVWQILTSDGRAVVGPPERHNGAAISGRLGWRTKRDAFAALVQLKRIVAERGAR